MGGLFEGGERLLAVNRPLAEDGDQVVTDETLGQVLAGIEYKRIDDQVGGAMQLASEVWRTFLILMIIALIAEALLSVPEQAVKSRPLTEVAA